MSSQEFIEKNKDLRHDNYCVLVYNTIGCLNREVILIYKNLDDFSNRLKTDIENKILYDLEFEIYSYN